MRICAIALALMVMPLLAGCNRQSPDTNYTAVDAAEDAALANLQDETNYAQGVGDAAAGMIPDANGHLPASGAKAQ